ncbi:hypothetical protein HYH03_005187 [Edaphochlamys debaryana]|uniref:Uncharacterized protein n=1 Tax=Edaphochlamys debaryana TaxID=47281 RepID=A0A836C2N0_9CHLO|nr:hypothetical protein HYH03_005187 [Edaphochlamys debaryana]|eukprot:KAG2496779.1 hypothetical protein HYH03_005187 [Edaphochlamys debaryana]
MAVPQSFGLAPAFLSGASLSGCHAQTLRVAPALSNARGPGATSAPAGNARSLAVPAAVPSSRRDVLEDGDVYSLVPGSTPGQLTLACAVGEPNGAVFPLGPAADDVGESDEDLCVFDASAAAEAATMAAAATAGSGTPTPPTRDVVSSTPGRTFIPVVIVGGPLSPVCSSSACSASSSVVLSDPSASTNASAQCFVPASASAPPCHLSVASSSRACPSSDLHAGRRFYTSHDGGASSSGAHPGCMLSALPSLAGSTVSCSSSIRRSLRDQNSVTIKATTVVKDAAGAIDKILSRGVTALVTALRSGPPPYSTAYDSLNQAVKAIAVARQYAKETGPDGAEVTFLPFHRNDASEHADPSRFAFLVFPVARLREALKTADETVLNVARNSDVHKMASAIIAVMLDRGQAVMKAAGSEAIHVAMSAVVNARHRLVAKHGFDLMLTAAWITEDTLSTMGRESKFLRFNILKTEPSGPKSSVAPSLPAALEAMC